MVFRIDFYISYSFKGGKLSNNKSFDLWSIFRIWNDFWSKVTTLSVRLWIHSGQAKEAWKTTALELTWTLKDIKFKECYHCWTEVIFLSWTAPLVLIVVYLLNPGLLAPAAHAAAGEGRVLVQILRDADPFGPNPDPKFAKKMIFKNNRIRFRPEKFTATYFLNKSFHWWSKYRI